MIKQLQTILKILISFAKTSTGDMHYYLTMCITFYKWLGAMY